MAEHVLAEDFKEFLILLNRHEVEYLVIGGYAVGYHGYPRTTADMDVWIAVSEGNARRVLKACREFGMTDPELGPALFQDREKIIRMGVPPMRIEILTGIDGVEFDECHAERETAEIDGVPVHLISLAAMLHQ